MISSVLGQVEPVCNARVPLLWESAPTERLPSCLVRVAHHVCALRAWASSDHRAGAGGRKGCRSPAATSYASTRRRRLIDRRHQGWAWWHEARIAPLRRPRAPNAQGQPSEAGAITRAVTPHRRVQASQKSMAGETMGALPLTRLYSPCGSPPARCTVTRTPSLCRLSGADAISGRTTPLTNRPRTAYNIGH